MDKQKFLAAWVKTQHFALYIIAVMLYAAHMVPGLIPEKYHLLVQFLALVLGFLGYGLGSAWSPPRQPWTDAERAARGLPPSNPSDQSSK
jgi:hypothetical protein